MRKTRLKILPARCLAMIGFILHYLACPILAEMSRTQPDSGLASSFQLEMFQHCSSPPEDPGDGGCANRWNAQMTTRNVSPDNGHGDTCYFADVFLLENICLVDQGPVGNTQGHPEPATRYAGTSRRRLLAARSKDPSAVIIKIQAPRRQIKYRSLKRRQVPEERLTADSPQRRDRTSTRTLLAVQSSERTALRGTDNTIGALSTERDVPKRMIERLLSSRMSELEVSRRESRERQSSSRSPAEHRTLAKTDVTRRMPTERQAYQKSTMERTSEVYGSRRMLSDSRPSRKLSADRRVSQFDFSRRVSTERRHSPRMLMNRILHESDVTRKLSGERQSERRVSSESRTSESRASRAIPERQASSQKMLTEHVMNRFDPSIRVSSEGQSYRRLVSDKVSEMRSGSRMYSERSFSETKLSHGSTLNSPQDDSRKTAFTRVLSERAQIIRRSTELLDFEQRSSLRRTKAKEQKVNAKGLSSRRNSLDETGRSESRRLARSYSEKIIDPERTSAIRRTTRSISSQTSADRRDSRMLQSIGMTSRSSRTGRLYRERNNVRITQDRVFHSTPSVQRLSPLSPTHKQNEEHSSESVSGISADRQNIRTCNDRLASRISSYRREASLISNRLLSTVSSTRLTPSSEPIENTPTSRIADNRRIIATFNEGSSSRRTSVDRKPFEEHRSLILYRERMSSSRLSRERPASEEKRNIRLNRERRPLSSERSGHHASFRTAKARRLSSDRSSPLYATRTNIISEERRISRTSPTTYGVLVTSRMSVSESPSGRRIDQTVARRTSGFTASKSMSNERVLAQRSVVLSRQNAPLIGSRGHQFTEMQISRNNHVTQSATRQSLSRSKEERTSAVRDSRSMYAERLATLRDSKRTSAEPLAQQRDSTSTERVESLRHSRRVYAKRLTSERESERSAGNVVPVREYRKTPAAQIKDSRSAERLAIISNSRRFSAERLTPKMFYSRSAESLASARGPTRITASLTHSRTSVEGLTVQTDSRSDKGLTHLRDQRRTSTERMVTQRNFRKSFERLTSVKDSRTIPTERQATQKSIEQSERFISHSNSIRSPEQAKSKRDYRIISDRVASTGASRRIPTKTLTHTRDSKRISPIRGSKRMTEGFTSVTRHRISPTLLQTPRNSRVSDEHFVSVRVSRRVSTEQLSTQKSSRSADSMATVLDMSKTYTERLASERDSRRSIGGLTSTRNSRLSERWVTDGKSRCSVERLTSERDSIRITSDRNFRYSVKLLTSIRNFRISAAHLASYSESRHSLENLAPVRFSRNNVHDRHIIPSVEHLTSFRKFRTSAERMSENISKSWVQHLAAVRISKRSAERLASDRHFVDHFVSVRDFRSFNDPVATERNSRRSVERLATMMNSRGIYSERSSRQSFERSASFKNARRLPTDGFLSMSNSRRTSLNQLKNPVRMSVSRKSLSDRLATRRVMTTAVTRTILSDHRVSELEPLSTIHITSKTLKTHDAMRMSNVRNTGLSDRHVSRNYTLDQGFRLSEKQFIVMDNKTLTTEPSLGFSLLFGTVQKSVVNISHAQYSSWSENAIEYIRCVLATLTAMWPSLAVWKGGVLKFLTTFDVASESSSEMDHLKSFFTDKPTYNYAHVPDDLALFHSTKATPPIMRDVNGILPTAIGGGVTAAYMLLSTKSK